MNRPFVKNQLKELIRIARKSERVLQFLMAFGFVLGAIRLGVGQLADANPTRLMVGIALLMVLFGLQYLVGNVPTKILYWALVIVLWISVVVVFLLPAGDLYAVFAAIIIAGGFAWAFVGRFEAVIFTLLTIIAAVFPIFAPSLNDLESSSVGYTAFYAFSAGLFAFVGALMIAQSEIQGAVVENKGSSASLRGLDENDEIALMYRAFFESNADGVLILDLDGGILDISDVATRMLGYEKKDLVGRNMSVVLPPMDQEAHSKWISKVSENSESFMIEQNLQKQNKEVLPVELNAGLVRDKDGRPLHVQVFFRDVSHRKRVELERIDLLDNLRLRTRQIQTAFEVSNSISSTLDLRNLLNRTVEIIKLRFDFYYVGVFLVEDEFAVLAAGSGEQGREMLSVEHRLPIGPSSMVGWCIEHKRARIAHDVGKDEVRFVNPMTPDTRSELAMPLIVHSVAIGALTVQNNYPGAFNNEDVAILQIIADQLAIAVQNAMLHEQLTDYAGELEERVMQRTFQLEELNQELESFSYSISHDLRAPLRAIHGFSNIIIDNNSGELTKDVRNYLEKINRNALKMGNLIDDILAFSRMGRQIVRKIDLDPNHLVREVLEDHEVEIKARGIRIELGMLPRVKADSSLFKQTMANLIGNAVKFTLDCDSPEIKIGFSEKEDQFVFYVKDNGVGFDMKYADRIFGVFQRMHREDEFEGTGVGLAIVQRIIKKHGGDVWFEAVENQGATFYFSLPKT